MAHKRLTVEEAIEIICNDESFDDFSVRGDDFVPDDKFNNSHYHGDDEPEYELPGVSAIFIPARDKQYIVDAIRKARHYGKNVFLLAGETGNNSMGDPDEILMTTHRIVGIISDK